MTISLPVDLLKAAILCASTEQTRYYLNGVFLSATSHMVATDGHRMFIAKLPAAPAADVIIPLDTIKAALKLHNKRDPHINLTDNCLLGQISFQPVDGTFPDWRRVVPTGEEMPSSKPELNDGAEHVHFNHAYIGDLAKMGKILDGASMLHPRSASHLCLATFGERADCFAVIMPMRRTVDRSAVLTRNVVMAG